MAVSQEQIARELGVKPSISVASEIQERVDFLCEYALANPGVRGFILGISGGQDSALAGRLVSLAVEKLADERGRHLHFVAVRLPYGSQADAADAELAMEFVQPTEKMCIDIKPSVDALVATLSDGFASIGLRGGISDFHRGNVKARIRMVTQYAIAGERSYLVIGTDHAAEAVTGFFTKFGDGAADVMPLAGLTKSQGAQMLQYLEAPSVLWQKQPTADLLDEQPGQPDEQSLGVSYAQIDAFLTGSPVSDAVCSNLTSRYERTQHKREHAVTPFDGWWK